MDAWRGFVKGKWNKGINLRDFINLNYTQYNGDASFLKGATERTRQVYAKVENLLAEEREKGVLDIDVENVSSILSFAPGYVDKDKDIIVGLQTDKPLKRAVNPFAGIRNASQACEAYGYKMSDKVWEQFKYRTTHNDGVFHAYSKEMRAARHAGVITGLPDAYARGRIIGDYRRIALYGMDYLIKCKQEDRERLQRKNMNESNIRQIEELYKQLAFMDRLKKMAEQYGYYIYRPAENAL